MTTRTSIDEILSELVSMKEFVDTKVDEKLQPTVDEVTRLASSMGDVEKVLRELRRDRLDKIQDGRIRVRTGRLAGMDLLDLKLLEEVMTSRVARGKRGRNTLELVQRTRNTLVESMDSETIIGWEEAATNRHKTMFPNGPAHNTFNHAMLGWRSGLMELHTKAALDSTTTGSGDELVPTLEAAELWMDVNLDTLVLPALMQVPMPSSPFDMPLQLGDTNWYPTSENVQALTTAPGTGKATLTAYGLKTGVPFSDELEEDAVIALIPEIRRSLVRNAAEIIDDILLNADTTTTNNINADGDTISPTTAGKAHWLLGFDGLIHLPLIDNTGQAVSHAAAVSADGYNEILALLGRYAIPRSRGEVVYFTDVRTAVRSLSITEFETVDVAGARATLSTGEIMNVYGKPLIQSEQMLVADADGKVTSAGNVANTGRILATNTTQWRVGFRRTIEVESDREAGKSQTTMYVSFRIALTERTGARSSATHTAMLYNITGI